MYSYLHVKYPLYQILLRLEFSRHSFESIQIYFMKIRPVGAELFHAGGRKDKRTQSHEKSNCRFSQLCERS